VLQSHATFRAPISVAQTRDVVSWTTPAAAPTSVAGTKDFEYGTTPAAAPISAAGTFEYAAQSSSGEALGTGAIVGICVGVAGALLLVGVAILLLLRRCRRGSGALSAKPAHPSGTERDTESLKELQTGHHKGQGLAIGPSSFHREAPPTHLPLPIHDRPYQQTRADPVLLPSPPALQDSVWSPKAHRNTQSEATSASVDVQSATTTSAVPTVSVTTHSATASGGKPAWAAEIATKTHDTFLDMTQQSRLLEPPGPGAGAEERRQFLHRQLDSLAGKQVLQGLLLLQGSNNRLQGGNVFGPDLVDTYLSIASAAHFITRFSCGSTFLFWIVHRSDLT
jgi:hypothetical protein